MTSPRHIFEAVKPYLAPAVDHLEVVEAIARAFYTGRDTLPAEAEFEAVAASVDAPATPPNLTASEAGSGDEAPIARDVPVAQQPATPALRADVRMGRNRGI